LVELLLDSNKQNEMLNWIVSRRPRVNFSRIFIRNCYGISSTSRLFSPSPEYSQFRDSLRSFVAKEVEPQAAEYNREEKMNLELLRKLGDLGVHGVCIDDKYGGSGMNAVGTVIAMEELSYSDPGLCLSTLAHSVLFVHNLSHNGSEKLKEKFLLRTISGELIGGMCMSEPNAGTDILGGMTTTARPDQKGGWVINGQKMWITNGCLSDGQLGDIFLVYAKTPKGLSLFVVEKGMKGFSLGQKLHDKCGMRSSNTAELVFEDCTVPGENLVGEEGKGTIPMMRNLEIERIALAAMSLGIAKRCIDVMTKYAGERKAFGKPIGSFGQIQRHIAESYAEYAAARSYIYAVAGDINLYSPGNRLDSDGVKLFATSMGKNVADRAIQVLGGYGYLGEYVVERLWRDAKLLEIGGGTIEAHQKNITADLVRAVGGPKI
jgi:isovaleryl-CoA dehydrogenase